MRSSRTTRRARSGGGLRTAAVAAMLALGATRVPSAVAADDDAADVALDDPSLVGEGFAATIRRTEFGIPHVLADDFGGLGFGYGYAFAQDNICTAADFYVTVRGERSRFFGPDGSWTFEGNGTTHNNLDSDFHHKGVRESGRIEDLLAMDPPEGPLPEIVDAVAGYVAGYNRYLADVGGPDGVEDPTCAGEEWVRPITEQDAYGRFYQLAGLASTGVAIADIGRAQPPTPDLLGGAGGLPDPGEGGLPELGDLGGLAELLDPATSPIPVEELPDLPGVSDAQLDELAELPSATEGLLGIGSNAYGFGSEMTESGAGLVLGNPHFPWEGGERLYHSHLTIPGVIDVQGASLYGVPVVLIGTTEGVAWSHTVSTAFRFTPFQVTLVPGSPTTYVKDGQLVEMDAQDVTVQVPDGDGMEERTRTLYRTEHGPMFTGALGLPLFPWTPAVGFAMGDANDHLRYLNHFFEKNLAQSVRDIREVTVRNQGVPWVNTIAADADGEAYYSDVSVVPNVPDAKVLACPTALGLVTFNLLGLPTLDGSRSACDWDDDPDAIAPGIFGPDNLPALFRDDFVHNGNDSYWLSNPDEPLTGFARIIGDEEAERTLRTRIGLRMVEDRADGSDDAGDAADGRWNRQLLEAATFDNRQYAAELMLDDLLELCGTVPVAIGTSGPQQTGQACDILASWDGRDDVDSVGALVFRRFLSNLQSLADPTGLGILPLPWTTPFDVDDPVDTPRDLAVVDPRVSAALADAIADLDGAGIPIDAPLGDWQYDDRGTGERIPIHGGPGTLSLFNAINVSWQGDPDAGETGYPSVPSGSSFVMVATFSDDGCPVDASALTTYSQSDDVTSPHVADQTREFSAKRFVPMRFCEEDVLASPDLTVTEVTSGGADGSDGVGGDGPDDGGDTAPDDGDTAPAPSPTPDAPRTAPVAERRPLPVTGQAWAAVLGLAALAGAALLRRRPDGG